MLGHPLVAVTLGTLLGVLLTLVSHRAIGHVTPEDPLKGLAVVTVSMGARLAAVIAALAGYAAFATDGLVAFGLALALSFIVGLGYEAVKASGIHTSRTSA